MYRVFELLDLNVLRVNEKFAKKNGKRNVFKKNLPIDNSVLRWLIVKLEIALEKLHTCWIIVQMSLYERNQTYCGKSYSNLKIVTLQIYEILKL